MAECPICEAEFNLAEDVEVSEIINCEECGSDLEVISIDPDVLEEAPEEKEDWGE